MYAPVIGGAIRWFRNTGSLRDTEVPMGVRLRGIGYREDHPGISHLSCCKRTFPAGMSEVPCTQHLLPASRLWPTGVSFLVLASALGYPSGRMVLDPSDVTRPEWG